MVFVLGDRAKIETDRYIDEGLTERYRFCQSSDDILTEDGASLEMGKMLETYVDVSQYYAWGKLTDGILGVFHDAFLNAAMWGNGNRPGSCIDVEVKYGLFGSAIFVKDEGQGFEYAATTESFRRGEPYAQRHGGGMWKFDNTHFHVSYHGNGNLISISTPLITYKDVGEFLGRPI